MKAIAYNIQAWREDFIQTYVKSPKLFIRDSGIFHTLLGIHSSRELAGHSVLGMSWEGFCLEHILGRIPRGWDASFYRTQAGAEVDLVLQRRIGESPIAIEFKYSQSPKLTKGFWEAKADLAPSTCYVVYSGTHAYPMRESVEVIPLSHIDKIWQH